MTVYEENAGTFVPFVKDGRSDDLYYHGSEFIIEGKDLLCHFHRVKLFWTKSNYSKIRIKIISK